jgi:hypothetical protein
MMLGGRATAVGVKMGRMRRARRLIIAHRDI